MKCKTCTHKISLILNPYQDFKKQIKAFLGGFCSIECQKIKQNIKSKSNKI